MALSPAASSSVNHNSANLKTSQNESKQADKGRLPQPLNSNTEAQAPVGDNVALSKAAEISASRETGQNSEISIEQLLPRTLQAIVQNSDTALAAQANITAESAKGMLA